MEEQEPVIGHEPDAAPCPDEDTGELMYVRCAVCGEWLDVKPGKLHWVSHGLCGICQDKELARVQAYLAERERERARARDG